MNLRTITADRPEVVTAVKDRIFAPLTGMIGARLFPLMMKRDKVGKIYHKTLDADDTADTRETNIAAFARTAIASSSADFSCGESYKVYQVPLDQAKDLGGVEASDRVGVSAACRSVVRKHEGDVAGKFFTTAIYNAAKVVDDNDILLEIQMAAYAIARYYGKTVLVASHAWFQKFALATAVQNRLIAIIGNAFNAEAYAAAVAGNAPMAVSMLKAIMPIDEFLIGEDAYWAPSGKEDMAIVAKAVPSEIVGNPELFDEILREQPVLGVTPWFLPDPAAQDIFFEARSWHDEDNAANCYRATGWYDVELLNAAYRAIKFSPVVLGTTTTSTAAAVTTTTAAETTTTTTSSEA